MFLLIAWVINTIALFVTEFLVPGIEVDNIATFILAALIIGLVNALIKPIIHIISLPITLLTFGLFALVTNAAMLGLAAWLVPGFEINGILAAILGALVLSAVSAILNAFLKPKRVVPKPTSQTHSP